MAERMPCKERGGRETGGVEEVPRRYSFWSLKEEGLKYRRKGEPPALPL